MIIRWKEPIFPKVRTVGYSVDELVGKLALSIYQNSGWYEETFLTYMLTKKELPTVSVKRLDRKIFLSSYLVYYEIEIDDEDFDKLLQFVIAEIALECWDRMNVVDDEIERRYLTYLINQYLLDLEDICLVLGSDLYFKVREIVKDVVGM